MNLLIVGSSSEIAIELIKKLKKLKQIKIYTLSRKKSSLRNHYYIKDYNERNLINFKKNLKEIKFDKIIFFNGYQKFSVLSFIFLSFFCIFVLLKENSAPAPREAPPFVRGFRAPGLLAPYVWLKVARGFFGSGMGRPGPKEPLNKSGRPARCADPAGGGGGPPSPLDLLDLV